MPNTFAPSRTSPVSTWTSEHAAITQPPLAGRFGEETARFRSDSSDGTSGPARQGPGSDLPRYSPRLNSASPEIRSRRYELLKKWIGTVTDVRDTSFYASLADAREPEKDLEIVELSKREVPEADAALLVPGAVFYWSIGYAKTPGGTVSRNYELRFRREPLWSEAAVENIKREAGVLFEQFTQGPKTGA